MVDSFASSGIDICQWNQRFATAPKEPGTITLPLTYPGSFDLGPAFKPLLQEVTRLFCIRRFGDFGLAASTCGDAMYIRSCQRFDSPAIIKTMQKELEQAGLKAAFSQLPAYRGNQMVMEKLLRI